MLCLSCSDYFINHLRTLLCMPVNSLIIFLNVL
jgi:hypothetical protein